MEEQNENRKLTNAELELQADAAGAGEVKRISYAGLIARRFFRQKSAIAGLIVLAVMVLIAVVGPMVCPYDYTEPDFAAILFACVAHGLGRSLVIGISYALLTMIIAAVIGTAIAYVRGWGEKIGMWILDMLLVIPSFLLVAMIVRAASGATGWLILILGLTAFGWIGYARTLRTMALSLRERDYVKAAKYMGLRDRVQLPRPRHQVAGHLARPHPLAGLLRDAVGSLDRPHPVAGPRRAVREHAAHRRRPARRVRPLLPRRGLGRRRH